MIEPLVQELRRFRIDLPTWQQAMPRPAEHAAVRRRGSWIIALLASDILACFVSIYVAAAVLVVARVVPPGTLSSARLGLTVFFLASGVIYYLGRHGHYRHRHPFWTQARHVGFAGALCLIIAAFSQLSEGVLRPELLLGWLIMPFAMLGMRAGTRAVLTRLGLWNIRILVVGNPAACARARTAIQSEPACGYVAAGFIDMRDWERQNSARPWSELLFAHRAEILLIAEDDISSSAYHGIVEAVVKERIQLAMMPFLGGMPVHGCEQLNFFRHDVMLLKFKNNLADPLAIMVKRATDLAITLTFLIICAPLLAILVLLVKLDGGPAFFPHKRLGPDGRTFHCLKLRTMVCDSEAVLKRTLESDPAAAMEWAKHRKLSNDPRVTRIGRLLRLTSLDELPQLVNVLRGDMSLVGPRPIVTEEVPFYGADIDYYFETRPGITGLWQVSGRSDVSFKRRVELDVWYVKNWTLWHDLAILLMTLSAVFSRKGAR